MSLPRRVFALYRRIWQAYRAWSPEILVLALIIFLPLGLLDALTVHVDLEALDLTSGIKVAAVFLAVAVLTTTGLLGEIFFSGAISVALTHADGDGPPPLRQIARHIRYGQLVLVDLAFVVIVSVALPFGGVPGVLAFVFLCLAGPVVEMEQRSAWGALRRSAQLVRGSFWFVVWVVVPVEVAGDAVGRAIADVVHSLLGESFAGAWLAEGLSGVVLSPVFAIAAVLLTVELVARKEGAASPLHATPAPA